MNTVLAFHATLRRRYHAISTLLLTMIVGSFFGYGTYLKTPFVQAATSITISGIIWNEDPMEFPCASDRNLTVVVKVNGAGSYSGTCTADDGTYTVNGVSVNPSDVITVFVDDGSLHAAYVTKAPSVPTNINRDIYQYMTEINHEGGGTITNTDLDQYDSGQNANIDFTVTSNNLSMLNGSSMDIVGGVYVPGGTITGNTILVEAGATITLGANGNSLLGLYSNGGVANINGDTTFSGSCLSNNSGTITYTAGTPTVTCSGVTIVSMPNSYTFYNLTFTNGARLFSDAGSTVTINHDFSIGNGVVVDQRANLVVGGSLTTTGTGSITYGSGTPSATINGSAIGGGSGDIIFYNLTKSAAGTTTWTASGSNIVRNQLTVSAGTLVTPSQLLVKSIDDTGGTISAGSGTIYLQKETSSTINLHSTLHNLVINDGLVGYYKLDESSAGSAADQSGFGNTGTAVGSPTVDSSVPTTQFSNAKSLSFNGSSQYVDLGNPATLSTEFGDTMSLSAWIKPSSVTGFHNIVGKSYTSPHSDPFYVWNMMQISAFFTCRLDSTIVQSSGVGSGALTSGVWQHVACVYNGSTLKAYINGVEVGSANRTGDVLVSTRNARIGARDTSDMGEYFGGNIDDVRIYNRALSTTEIQMLTEGQGWGYSSATYTLGAPLSLTGNFVLPTGTFDASASNYGLTVGGSLTVSGGSIVPRAGTITLNGTGGSNTIATGRQQLYNLTVSGVGGTYTLQERLDVLGALAVSAGTFDVSTSNYPVTAGTINQTGGTIQPRSGTISLRSNGNTATALSSNLSTLRIEDPSEDHLFGYWKLDEGVGTSIQDASGQGNTGTLTNGFTWTSSVNSTTQYDNPLAIDLDGTNDYVTMGNVLNVSSTADFTIAGWFNRDTSNTDDVIVAKRNGSAAGDIGYIVWIDAATDKLRMEVSDGTNEYELASSATFTTTGWHHFVVTWDESLVAGTKMYIDGSLDAATATGTLASVGTLLNAVALRIGAESDAGAPFDGKIDDIRYYDTPITAAQAALLGAGRYILGNASTATFTFSGTSTINTLVLDSGVLNSGTATLNVSTAFSLLDGQGAYVGGSGTQTFSSGITVSGSSFSTGGSIFCTGNYSQSAGTFIGSGGGSLSISGNLTFGSGATVTSGTSTIIMSGAGVTIDDNDKILGNLTISQTASTVNSGLYINGLLNISNGATLTLGLSRTARVLSDGTLSLNSTGTITGAGMLIYQSSTAFPTGGTISSILRMDATYHDQALSARTYGGRVELYNNSASLSSTVAFGTASSQTLQFSENLYLNAANHSDITIDATTYNPNVTVAGDVVMNGAGAGVESWIAGDGTWTVTGNVDIAQGFYAPHVIILNPTWDNYGYRQDDYSSDGAGGCDFDGSTYSAGNSSDADLRQGNDTGASTSCTPSASDYFYRTYLKFNLGSVSSAYTITRADLQLYVTSAGGSFNAYRSNNDTPDAVAGSSLYAVGLSTGLNNSYTFGAGTNLISFSVGGNRDLQSALGNSAYAVVLESGVPDSVISSVDSATNKPKLRIGYYTTATSPTLIMNGTGTLSSGPSSGYYNLTMSGTNTFNASHQATIANTLALTGTITANTAPIVMVGSAATVIGGNNTIGNITVDGGTTTLATSDLATSLNVQLLNGGTLNIGLGRTFSSTGNVLLNSGTTITGAGTLRMTSASSGPGTAGTLSSRVRYDATSANIPSTTFDARVYGGPVELYSSSGSARTATMAGSTYTLSGSTADLILIAGGTANMTLDAQTNNATVTVGGAIDFQGAGAGTERITPGSNTWTVGGNIDFTDGVFLAPTNHTLSITGSGSTITFAGQTPYNLSTQSGSATTILDAVTVTHTLNVASSSTLTLGGSSVLTVGSPVTLQGTIDGPGMMWLDPSATIGTTGTIGTNVTFDATSGTLSVPTRSFTGSTRTITLLNDASSTTLGSGAGTISIDGNLLIDDGGAEATYDGTAYNPNVIIGGNFSLGGSAYPDIFLGSGTWTVAGNVDLAQSAVINGSSATLRLTGTNKTFSSTNDSIGHIQIQGSITATSAFHVGQELVIDPGATLTASATTTTVSGDFLNSGTFQGASGTVLMNASSTGHTVVCGSGSFNNLVFNHASGGWTVQTNDCSVNGALTLTAASAWTLASGRTMSVSGNFTNSIGGGATTWTGSTLYLQGTGTNTINSSAVTEQYGSVHIGASRQVGMWNTTIGSLTIDSGGGLRSYDDQGTDGRLYIAGAVTIPDGEAWSYTTDFDGVALGTERAVAVVVEPNSTVVVPAGNDLAISGEEFATHRTVVDRAGSSGNFAFQVDGVLSAEYFEFHHLNNQGVAVSSSGSISKLDYGIFDDGVSGGSYVSLMNATSTLTSTAVVFDAGNNGIDSATPKAITATGSGIAWTMNGSAGYRTGAGATVASAGASIIWNIPTMTVLDGLSSDADVTTDIDQRDVAWTPTSTQYVASFAVGLGTTSGGVETVGLTDVGSVVSTTLSGLTLVDGQTYYSTVVARNSIQEPLFVGTSDGIRVDSSSPDILDLSVTASQTSATVQWTTNELATTVVELGTTTDLGSTPVESGTLSTSHSGTLSGLSVGTTYYVRVTSVDAIGNTAQSEIISFTTTSPSEVASVVRPTLYQPVYRRTGNAITLMVTGITRQSSAVRLYVDGKLHSTYIIKSTSEVTSFAIPLSFKGLKNGSHSYYVRAVGTQGDVSDKSSVIRFTVSGSTTVQRTRLSTMAKYVVQRGDSLWSIARRFVGSGANYKQLVTTNSQFLRSLLSNASRIHIGWVLRIPGF